MFIIVFQNALKNNYPIQHFIQNSQNRDDTSDLPFTYMKVKCKISKIKTGFLTPLSLTGSRQGVVIGTDKASYPIQLHPALL